MGDDSDRKYRQRGYQDEPRARGPKGAPPAIVNKLHDAIVATMDTPAVQDRLKSLGVSIVATERRSPDYLAKFVQSEVEKWAGPIKASGVVAD